MPWCLQVPLAIDVLGAALAVASEPLEIKVLRVNLTGDLTPLGTPTASFQRARCNLPQICSNKIGFVQPLLCLDPHPAF